MALQAEFHEFFALTLCVIGRKICLRLTIRSGDHVGWLENTALEFALEMSGLVKEKMKFPGQKEKCSKHLYNHPRQGPGM